MNIFRPTAVLCLSLLPSLCALAQEGSALDRLPAETVGAVVIPDGGKWLDELTKTSRLGQLMSDSSRWNPVWEALKNSDDKGEFEKFQNELGRLNLKNEDFKELLKHDVGMGVIVLKTADGKSLPLLLAWSGCGQAMADKMKAAALDPKVIEGDTRIDLNPSITCIHTAGSFEPAKTDDENDDATPAKPIQKSHCVFLASSNGYLILALLPQEAKDAEEFVSFEALATPVITTFVEAQKSEGQGAFSKRLAQSPAITSALAAQQGATPAMQILLDTQAIVALIQNYAATKHPEKATQTDKLIKGLGLDSIGPIAFTSFGTPGHMNSSLAIDCPAPRRGLMRLLDQQHTAPSVPDWVDGDAMQYAQYNFDLAGAMDIVVDSMKAAAPSDEEAMQIDSGLAMGNGFVAAQLGGAQIRDVLASFGGVHQMISYPPSPNTLPADASSEMIGADILKRMNMAVVWQDAKPELWNKVMNLMSKSMGAPQSPFEHKEEQGYSGWASKENFPNMPMSMGYFLGQKGLVYGLGKESARKTITALSTQGKHNHLLDDCKPVMPLRDAWIQVYGDSRPQIKNTFETQGAIFGPAIKAARKNAARQAGKEIDTEKSSPVFDALSKVMLTEKEIDECFGMSAAQGWTDNTGLRVDSGLILQPAKK